MEKVRENARRPAAMGGISGSVPDVVGRADRVVLRVGGPPRLTAEADGRSLGRRCVFGRLRAGGFGDVGASHDWAALAAAGGGDGELPGDRGAVAGSGA